MSDLFHADLDAEYIRRVVDVMMAANWHTYQVLTKRSERLAELLAGPLRHAAAADHIWWGVSVENRKHGLPRVEHLRSSAAAVRLLSVEPLLEDLGPLDLTGIHWVIAGGESGHGARPLEPEWVRSLRDRCEARAVPFFFKQWGGVRKHLTGRTLDGRTHDEVPARVDHPMPGRAQRLKIVRQLQLLPTPMS